MMVIPHFFRLQSSHPKLFAPSFFGWLSLPPSSSRVPSSRDARRPPAPTFRFSHSLNCVCFDPESRQFVQGVSLAAAAASAAAEPEAEDTEAAAADAPTCALCLSPRKQVRGERFAADASSDLVIPLQAACTSCGHVFCWRCIAGARRCFAAVACHRLPSLLLRVGLTFSHSLNP